MNWQHMRAFVWLRWRLLYNQYRRVGIVSAVLLVMALIGAVLLVIPFFCGSIALGVYAIPKAEPAHLMYVWDGLILGFLMFWSIGLLTELQRTESLALSKFLHLPVSAKGAFLINYFSSLVRFSMLVFFPLMLGYAVSLIYVKGLEMVFVLPLLATFLLMVTGLTYQFQGWLGTLMSNPRRRRTVIVVFTTAFILVFQLPNLFFNVMGPALGIGPTARRAPLVSPPAIAVSDGVDPAEVQRQLHESAEKQKLQVQQAERANTDFLEKSARLVNMVLPIGWLPVSVCYAAEGNVFPSLLGFAGMGLIGSASLWSAYKSTIKQYQGSATSKKIAVVPTAPAASTGKKARRDSLLEARLTGLSEPVSAIALGGFQSLIRAPEAKMMLLSPLLMIPIVGFMLMRGNYNLPDSFRPLVAIGVMVFVFFGLLQLMGNPFGFDRDGFRVFVLSSASRRDILFGKNLSFAPIVLGMAAVLLPIVQFLFPLRFDHLLAMIPQYVSMFLLFCVLANVVAIYAPMRIAAGSLKASNPKLTTGLLYLLIFMVIFPITQGITLVPLGVEALSNVLGYTKNAPIYLILSLVECAIVIVFYRLSLGWLGIALQAREERILEVVTSRAL